MPAENSASEPAAVSARAAALHAASYVVDGASFFLHGHNERIQRGGLTAIVFMVPMPQDDLAATIGRIREYYEIAHRDPKVEIAWSVEVIERCKREGKLAAIIGCQNSRFLGTELTNVEVFARLGMRVVQLTYNERNAVADGCLEPENAGLSFFGRKLIRELNACGIVVDLSHCGERSSLDAIEVSVHPVIFSHAGLRAMVDNPRTITDAQVRAVAARGGVVGVSSFPTFNWRGGPTRPSLDDFLDALDHAINLVGIDHVGVGTDHVAEPGGYPQWLRDYFARQYDDYSPQKAGINARYRELTAGISREDQLEGFGGMHDMPRLTEGLLRRGYKDEDVQKVLGGNFMRIFRTVWPDAPRLANGS
jgi:membrane dipeptidase